MLQIWADCAYVWGLSSRHEIEEKDLNINFMTTTKTSGRISWMIDISDLKQKLLVLDLVGHTSKSIKNECYDSTLNGRKLWCVSLIKISVWRRQSCSSSWNSNRKTEGTWTSCKIMLLYKIVIARTLVQKCYIQKFRKEKELESTGINSSRTLL